ncbi:MAG: extensin family protein [Hyphomicrobiaceae bacterium]|nr:extensin family protein [Hyphomicrobiaceae bacterium]
MIQALRVLTALAIVAPSFVVLSVVPASAQKSISRSISDGWESVIKDASKAAKKVTKAADDALAPKKSKKRKSVKRKDSEDEAEPKQQPAARHTDESKQAREPKHAEEDDGPPVPLTQQSPAQAEGQPNADNAKANSPKLKKQAAPARRLPPPPAVSAAPNGTRAQPDWETSADPVKAKALPQAEIVPLKPGKNPPAPAAAAPSGKPLPITMIPPKPADPTVNANAWPKEEIEAAKASCAAILKSVQAVTIAEAPVREGGCGAPAPVRLVSIGKNPEVALSPPPLVTCELVAGLYQWMKNDIQPLSKKHFGAPVIKIETMSDYSCRMAYGRKGNKLSEHGKANALDIRGFVTARGETAYVLEQWGKTDRDRKAELAALAAQKEAAAKATSAAANAGSKTAVEQQTANAVAVSQASLSGTGLKPGKLEGRKLDMEQKAAAVIVPEAPMSKKTQFLHDAHDTACRVFGTSLGPESNEAHRNHFHVDMAERKRTKICE